MLCFSDPWSSGLSLGRDAHFCIIMHQDGHQTGSIYLVYESFPLKLMSEVPQHVEVVRFLWSMMTWFVAQQGRGWHQVVHQTDSLSYICETLLPKSMSKNAETSRSGYLVLILADLVCVTAGDSHSCIMLQKDSLPCLWIINSQIPCPKVPDQN